MIFLLMLVTFLLTLACTAFFIRHAPKFGFVDMPNERSMHAKPIPRGAGFCFGGIAILVSLVSIFLGLNRIEHYWYVYLAVAMVFFAGLLDDRTGVMLASVFMAATAAFLLFNWYPAKVFMGDSGSLTLGFVISILAVRATHFIEPTAVLFIVVLPVLDTFIVMTRRIQRGLSPFTADKTHMHHILYNRYEDVAYTTILLVYIQIAFTLIGVQLRNADGFLSLILFGILFFIMLNLFDQRIKHRPKGKKFRSSPTARKFIVKKEEKK